MAQMCSDCDDLDYGKISFFHLDSLENNGLKLGRRLDIFWSLFLQLLSFFCSLISFFAPNPQTTKACSSSSSKVRLQVDS